MEFQLIQAASDQDFVQKGTEVLSHSIKEALTDHGICILGLSGGSTPKPIYEALGRQQDIDWAHVWIFLTDERFTSPDDPESNQHMVRETLLKNASIPSAQFIVPDTTLPLEACIEGYALDLMELFRKGPVEIVTLGLGEDGHIASLFPPLNDLAFGEKLVIHTQTDRFAVKDRISVTMHLLQDARSHIFFLKGAGKKKVWDEMMGSDEEEQRWPAKAILELERSTVVGMW